MSGSLDNKLRELTGYRLRRATSASMPEINRLLVPFGLRRTTYSALTVVADNPGLSQSQLAKALSIERPNIVQIIDELEKPNLVERRAAPNDRRTYALRATDAGMKLQSQAQLSLRQYEDELTRGMSSSDIEQLHGFLSLIEANASNRQLNKGENENELKISRS